MHCCFVNAVIQGRHECPADAFPLLFQSCRALQRCRRSIGIAVTEGRALGTVGRTFPRSPCRSRPGVWRLSRLVGRRGGFRRQPGRCPVREPRARCLHQPAAGRIRLEPWNDRRRSCRWHARRCGDYSDRGPVTGPLRRPNPHRRFLRHHDYLPAAAEPGDSCLAVLPALRHWARACHRRRPGCCHGHHRQLVHPRPRTGHEPAASWGAWRHGLHALDCAGGHCGIWLARGVRNAGCPQRARRLASRVAHHPPATRRRGPAP